MVAQRRVAGLILAAGESRRMGRPKALVELEGRSFLAHGFELLRGGGCEPVLAVEGAHRLRGRFAGELPGLIWVENADWALGPLASLQAGLRAALAELPELDGLLVHHVERPRVRAETVRALLRAGDEGPERCCQPSYEGRSGHPMLWPRRWFCALLELDPRVATARTLLRDPSRAPPRFKLPVDDPGVVDNLDTPAALARLKSRAKSST